MLLSIGIGKVCLKTLTTTLGFALGLSLFLILFLNSTSCLVQLVYITI